MTDFNTQGKEQIIVGTIINANNIIRKMYESNVIKQNNNNTNVYHYNMIQLFESINDNQSLGNINDIINIEMPESYKIDLQRENYYAYFKKVNMFLNGYEINLQKTLNESLDINTTGGQKIDIFNFKSEVNKILIDLEATNDFEKYDTDILKIKTFTNSPLFVCGFNLSNNLVIQQEIFDKFKVNNLLSICYDKTNKRLLFITDTLSTTKIICYDIVYDKLDYYNNVELNGKIAEVKLEPKTYLQTVKSVLSNNNIYELFFNISLLKLEFTDNLYFDKIRKQVNSQKSIVK